MDIQELTRGALVADTLDVFEADLVCSLCDGLFDAPCTLPCGHTFCKECVQQTLCGKGVYKNECPHPRCTSPVFVKDLSVNQTIANICLNIRFYLLIGL